MLYITHRQMEATTVLFIVSIAANFIAVFGTPVWNAEPLHACPSIPAQKGLLLDQVAGDWRLAYLFLGQVDEGMDEDNTCVVVSLTPSNDSQLELALFIDSLRAENIIDRSTMQFPADIVSPGEWKLHTPLTNEGYLHARVIRASDEHLVVTFCGPSRALAPENDVNEGKPENSEETIDWRSLFETSRRRKRSYHHHLDAPETHMWTAVLVKHNDVSALKFVEYAAVLMKHGYDVTQGELVSFGRCPIAHQPHIRDPL